MNEVVYTQDISSGRIHKRYRMPGGNLASFEGCNLDDAGDYIVLADDYSNVKTGAFCRNCYAEGAGAGEDDGSTQPEMVP